MIRSIPDAIAWLTATAAAVAGFLFGRIDGVLLMLFVFAAMDYLLGSAVACQGKGIRAWNRDLAVEGFTKKLAMMAVVIAANLVGRQLDDNGAFRGLAILGFVYIEGTSILRNVRLLGVQIPTEIDSALDRLKPGAGAPPKEDRP